MMSSMRTNRKQQNQDEAEEVKQPVEQDEAEEVKQPVEQEENESLNAPESSTEIKEPANNEPEEPKKPRRTRKRARALSQEDLDTFAEALQDQSSEQDQEAARRDFCTRQVDVYTNSTAGWAFWGMIIARPYLEKY